MIEIITVLLLAIGIYFLYHIWNQQNLGSQSSDIKVDVDSPKRYSTQELRLENVKPGGVIKLTSVGPDMEDFDVSIIGRHIYREGKWTWYELEGDRGGEKVWIEFVEDDELEISIKVKDLKLRDLNLSKSDLERMDDEEDGQFTYNKTQFFYEDSGQAVFYRDGIEKNAEKFYYWDFEDQEGEKFVGVESWDGSLEASLSYGIRPNQVTVYSLEKES